VEWVILNPVQKGALLTQHIFVLVYAG